MTPAVHKTLDCLTASAPILGSITFAELNSATQWIGGVLGILYLLWKWRRDAQAKKRRNRWAVK